MATFAGQFGPYTLIDDAGNKQPTATVTVRNAANTANATVYADRARTAVANPLPTGVAVGAAGVDGNATVVFFADPGRYTLRVLVGSTTTEYPVQVYAEEGDTDLATQAELDAHAGAADPHPTYLTAAEGAAAYGPLRLVENVQTAAYTLALADEAKVVAVNAAAAVTVTIPANATVAFPVGTVIEVYQAGAGQVTIAGAAGVTLRAPNGAKTAKQFSSLSLRKRAVDEWVSSGDTVV